ncbi:MAG: hypothetical protein D8M58_22210 [Calditrichaeota bacterium]|nr:MAG: hypothetical protein DWQ03_08600 [Calditrichota bacterium]MBL1208128.1 hypothetical protein [Calditrichota bacterium]
MGEALKEAYSDIFLIKEHPTSSDYKAVEGKFKSYHNVSDNVALNMRRTFYSLLEIADLKTSTKNKPKKQESQVKPDTIEKKSENLEQPTLSVPGLHYNIQIHLPATKDVEVYNAIFKSLKEHLF